MLIDNFNVIVLLESVIKGLNIIPDGVYIDGTFGQGGHSKAILSNLDKNGRLLAIDRDLSSVQIGRILADQDERFLIIHGRFSKLLQYVKKYNLLGKVNGILLDLGLSRFQLQQAGRGFSFINDDILDMRMDTSHGISAATWLQRASLENIVWVLRTFGEEKFAKRIARAIIQYRRNKFITRTNELVKLIMRAIPYHDQRKHVATRTFQAIRIYINNELVELEKALQAALFLLAPKGRLLVISFHSLEDRIVKYFIHKHSVLHNSMLCQSSVINKLSNNDVTTSFYFNLYKHKLIFLEKIMSSQEEIKKNISSRSAILRCAEKIFI